MSAPVRIALFGAGSMGAHHARVVAESDAAELAMVIDPDLDRADAVAGPRGASVATAVDAVVGCDAAVIASSTDSHVEIALALLDRGTPLLIEKPMAEDVESLLKLIDRSSQAGIPIMCGFVERFNPVIRTALELIEGPVIHMVALRHSPPAPRIRTSVVWDLLIHDIDLAVRFIPDAEISGLQGTCWTPPGFAKPELVDATVRFGADAIATLSASRVGHRKVRQISVGTEKMLVELDLVRQDITVWRHIAEEIIDGRGGTYRANTVYDIPFVRSSSEPLAQQLKHFLGLIDGSVDADVERTSVVQPHVIASRLAALDHAPEPA